MQNEKIQKNFFRRFSNQWQLQGMALSGVGWMLLFCLVPLIWLIIAFQDFNVARPIWEAPFVGLKHFKMFFNDPRFFRVLKNTFGISGLKLLFGFPIPILLSLFLNEIRFSKIKKIMQTATYLPHFISWAIFGGILLSWLGDKGIVNQVAIGLGIQEKSILYNSVPDYFWGISFISDTWKEMGWNAIIYLAAISSIDPSLYDAAEVDGAGRFMRMWYITVQGIRPTIAVLFIMACGNMLVGNFDQIFVLRNGLNLRASETLDLFIYNMGLSSGRFSYATAITLTRSFVSLVLLLLANWFSRKMTNESLF